MTHLASGSTPAQQDEKVEKAKTEADPADAETADVDMADDEGDSSWDGEGEQPKKHSSQ